MSLERFCRKPVVVVNPSETAQVVAQEMLSRHVGAVVVATPNGLPLGILTDRDLTCRVLAPGKDAARVTAGEVMTPEPQVIDESRSLDEAIFTMRSHGIRRLPVVKEDGRLVGMVSLDDLLVLLGSELGSMSSVARDNQGP